LDVFLVTVTVGRHHKKLPNALLWREAVEHAIYPAALATAYFLHGIIVFFMPGQMASSGQQECCTEKGDECYDSRIHAVSWEQW
jgi:hypothetical protein